MKLKAGGQAVIIMALVGTLGYGLYKIDFDKKIIAATGAKSSPTVTAPAEFASVGTLEHPLTVCLVSFHGYAPALLANGKSLTTQPNSIYDKKNLNVKFIIQ